MFLHTILLKITQIHSYFFLVFTFTMAGALFYLSLTSQDSLDTEVLPHKKIWRLLVTFTV